MIATEEAPADVVNTVEALEEESAWLLEQYLRAFRRAGVELDETEKDELRELNAELTSLETEFSQRVVKGFEAEAVHAESAEAAELGEMQ